MGHVRHNEIDIAAEIEDEAQPSEDRRNEKYSAENRFPMTLEPRKRPHAAHPTLARLPGPIPEVRGYDGAHTLSDESAGSADRIFLGGAYYIIPVMSPVTRDRQKLQGFQCFLTWWNCHFVPIGAADQNHYLKLLGIKINSLPYSLTRLRSLSNSSSQ
jgi:hypothetical protein